MQIKLVINNSDNEDLVNITLDASLSISSWLIDYYFTNKFLNEVKISNKSIQPKNIIGLHDMFNIYQILIQKSVLSSKDFIKLCQNKLKLIDNDCLLNDYDNYLNRCGLIDIIDLFHYCKLNSTIKMLTLNLINVKNDIDRLIFDYLLERSLERYVFNIEKQIDIVETNENIQKLFNYQNISIEKTISKNYIKHTLCTYLLLLMDTRNEHALVHCLVTPTRTNIERRTIVELRRLSKLSKNECLTMYQILVSFIRRKELLLSRVSSSQKDSVNTNDETFQILDKYYVGIKEFFDFLEQLQMTIEENEHLKIESIVTFRKLLTLIGKQLRKDTSFSRCDIILKDITEELCQCFEMILKHTDCASPTRSASFGGTLAGRRFYRSVAYLCAKQIVDLPLVLPNNDHYDSPSTGLRKATSSHLLRSPLTPLPLVIDQEIEETKEEKSTEIIIESVFMWQHKNETKNNELISDEKRYRRRKSQRCLDLSTIDEISFDVGATEQISSGSMRQPLGEIDIKNMGTIDREFIDNESTNESHKSIQNSLASQNDKENVSLKAKKRSISSINSEPMRKKQKKVNTTTIVAGQKPITNFFRTKT